MNAKEFIDQLLQYQEDFSSKKEYIETAIDYVYNNIDDLMLTGQFDVVDEIIGNIPVEKFELSILLSFLTISIPAKLLLKNRDKFYELVEKQIFLIGRGNYSEDLLRGLK